MKHKRLKSIIVVICMLILIVNFSCTASAQESVKPQGQEITASTNTSYIDTDDEAILQMLIDTMETRQLNAHIMADAARALGYDESRSVIVLAQEEYEIAGELKIRYEAKLIDVRNQRRATEYPNATYVWNYLRQLGYNDYVCAGIIGNMMIECGGQTLNLIADADGRGYYGICQWSKRYYPSVNGANLAQQCDFLRDTIKTQFDTYGFCYQSGFDYNQFLKLTNEKEAALAFAKVYERCGSGSYGARQTNATKAYDYFVD